MPLQPCQGCGKQVDTTAKACPGCGRPKPTVAPPPKWAYLFSFGLLGLMGWCVLKPDEYDKARTRSEGISAPATHERSFETKTIAEIAALESSDNGKKLCACGFVVGTTSAAANTIYLSDRSDKKWKTAAAKNLLCVWENFGAKNSFSLPERSPACVRGTLSAPMLKDCSVVDNCP